MLYLLLVAASGCAYYWFIVHPKKLEIALYKVAVDLTQDGVLICDRNSIIQLANKAWDKTGWAHKGLVGQHINVLTPPHAHKYHVREGIYSEALGRRVCPYSYVMGAKSMVVGQVNEQQILLPDGSTEKVFQRVAAVRVFGRQYYVAWLPSREKYDELVQDIEDSQRVWRHDLLSAVKGTHDMLELLQLTIDAEKLDADSLESLELAAQSAEATYNLVFQTRQLGDIRGLIKVDRYTPERLFDLLRLAYLDANVIWPNAFDQQPLVRVDPAWFIQRALTNVINNAIKYANKPGGMGDERVEISLISEDGFHVFLVADNGPGIPADKLDKIFEMGITSRLQPDIDGTGLGLYSAKKIVEAHGGKIWASSKMGAGSIFYLSVPD